MAQERPDPDRLSFVGHLDELRERLFKCAFAFFLGFILCYSLINKWVLEFLRAPLFEVLPPDQQRLYFTSLFENFMTHLKIAGVSSVFLLSPFYFYQLWAFIAPGLYPKERKLALPFIVASTLCFAGGAAFAYYVLFPVAFKFFVEFGLEQDTPMLTISAYYSTCLKLFLLFGLAFEMPVVICFMGLLGIIDAPFLRKNRGMAYIGISAASAIFAPPDAISMILLMAPLMFLFEGAILVIAFFGNRRTTDETLDVVPAGRATTEHE